MGWTAAPAIIIVTGLWTVSMFAVNTLNENREEKKEWAYSKDFFQRALLRRDWYLRREEETIKMAKQ